MAVSRHRVELRLIWFSLFVSGTLVSLEKARALVIRQADFSNTSRVVTFFTREFGKVAVVAKGAKRLKGPFDSALDLLTESQISFIRKSTGGLDILTEAKLTQRFRPQSGDMPGLYSSYYLAELLDSLSEPYDIHEALYDEAVLALARLQGTEKPGTAADHRLTVLRFELSILREIGQLPELESCTSCGRLLTGESILGLKVSQGGLVCSACLEQDGHVRQVTGGAGAILRVLAQPEDSAWQRLAPSPAQSQELRAIATAIISHTLGRVPRTLRYLN